MNKRHSMPNGMRSRPPSLSLVTVTSLDKQKKRNPFISLAERYRTEGLGFMNNKNLGDFYEESSIGTPTIVIDQGSDPDLVRRVITEEEMDQNQSDILSNHSIHSNHSPFIKYLTPPAKKSRKNPSPPSESGSISSISTITSHKKHRKTSESGGSYRSKQSVSKDSSKEEDAQSIGGCSIGPSYDFSSAGTHYVSSQMNDKLLNFMSVTYAILLIVVGAILCLNDLELKIHYSSNAFILLSNGLGFVWIAFLHWDIHRYKICALEYLKPDPNKSCNKQALNFDDDDISINTTVIFNSMPPKPVLRTDDSNASNVSPFETAYRFLHGKHSGNFYLKCGITVFCFGSIVHMGIQIFLNIYYYMDEDSACENLMLIFVLFIRIFYSFYQLFMAFKYSNIIINRYKVLARFALMHLVGTALFNWFLTIINEAIDDYVHKVQSMNMSSAEVLFRVAVEHQMYCLNASIINRESMEALPYLYPFTIEYNIILASVWYMIWTNIGKEHHNSRLHNIREEVSENDFGEEDVVYHSSLAINADCHASNRGLFGGLMTLLLTFITIIIFFTTINDSKHSVIGVTIYSTQIGLLTVMASVVIIMAYKQMRKLDIVNSHHMDNPSTAMDDLLVLVPIPFFLIHYILSMMAVGYVIDTNSVFLIVIYILTIFQVLIQSPFLVDGLRRCSNAKQLRFKKPGRELVTFALIINVTLWILNTFELKSVEKYHGMQEYYGKMTWMVISHTTLPVMLFYRYHSSVCLSDIWKYAYEKDHITHM